MKIKQIVSKNIKLAVFVFISISSISFVATDVAYADAATDTCKSFGYTGSNLAGCEYGYRNPAANKTDDELNKSCSDAGFAYAAGSRAACRVGAGIPNNTSLTSGAEAACKSVGYYGSFLNDCIKSYNENAGKTDDELKQACKDTGNTCYVGGKLSGAGGPSQAEQDCIAYEGNWTTKTDGTSYCADTKASCERGGGTWEVTGVNPSTGNPTNECKNGTNPTPDPVDPVNPSGTKECGGAKTNLIPCTGNGESAITGVLVFVLQIMSVGVGILAVAGITYGAILYASAQDNAGQTKKAIEVIMNTVIGLFLYIFMMVILNWLVPGGVIE